jgi:hypothetical protein
VKSVLLFLPLPLPFRGGPSLSVFLPFPFECGGQVFGGGGGGGSGGGLGKAATGAATGSVAKA